MNKTFKVWDLDGKKKEQNSIDLMYYFIPMHF